MNDAVPKCNLVLIELVFTSEYPCSLHFLRGYVWEEGDVNVQEQASLWREAKMKQFDFLPDQETQIRVACYFNKPRGMEIGGGYEDIVGFLESMAPETCAEAGSPPLDQEWLEQFEKHMRGLIM